MYPGKYAFDCPDKPAVIMAASGETITYGELEKRDQPARSSVARPGARAARSLFDPCWENHPRFVECCGAGSRSGLYFTCINSYLTAAEVAYIVNNSESRILITSEAKRDVALAAIEQCPNVQLCLIVDGPGDGNMILNLERSDRGLSGRRRSRTNILGVAMLYSSGTTGQPKGILRPLPAQPPAEQLPLYSFLQELWQYREGMIYLSPAPLYHSAPNAAVTFTLRCGGTAVIMENFDPEQYLSLIEKYRISHSQLVPTMFSRMLKPAGRGALAL